LTTDLRSFTPIPYHDGYLISREGVVLSLKWGKIRVLKQWINSNGYLTTKIDGRHYPLHRMLAHTFLPVTAEDYMLTINHKDGDKRNNSLDNLEIVSIRDNVLHAKRNGLGTMPEVPVRGTDRFGVSVVYCSQAQAARDTHTKQSNINKCIMGLRKTAGGLTWEKF